MGETVLTSVGRLRKYGASSTEMDVVAYVMGSLSISADEGSDYGYISSIGGYVGSSTGSSLVAGHMMGVVKIVVCLFLVVYSINPNSVTKYSILGLHFFRVKTRITRVQATKQKNSYSN